MPNDRTPPPTSKTPASARPLVHRGAPHGLKGVKIDPAVGKKQPKAPPLNPTGGPRPIPRDPLDAEMEADGPYTEVAFQQAPPPAAPQKRTGLIRHTPPQSPQGQQGRPMVMAPVEDEHRAALNTAGRPLLARGAPAVSETPSVAEVKETLLGSAGVLPPVVSVTRSERPSEVFSEAPLVRSAIPKGFQRITPPSGCIPYDFEELYIRPFTVEVLANVMGATQHGSQTMMFDALAPCLHQDIRDLTESDLRFCMYWWRLNSFTRSPFTVSWRSRYGNQCTTLLTEGKMKIVPLSMTRAEMVEYHKKGIRLPTVRDSEAIAGYEKTVDKNDRDRSMWLLRRAQYVHLEHEVDPSDYFTERIKVLNERGPEFLEDIRDFARKIEHGVTEVLQESDDKFEPEAAAQHLRNTAAALAAFQEQADLDAQTTLTYAEKIADLNAEAEEIEEKLAKGETPVPRKEDVVLTFDIMSCFPGI